MDARDACPISAITWVIYGTWAEAHGITFTSRRRKSAAGLAALFHEGSLSLARFSRHVSRLGRSLNELAKNGILSLVQLLRDRFEDLTHQPGAVLQFGTLYRLRQCGTVLSDFRGSSTGSWASWPSGSAPSRAASPGLGRPRSPRGGLGHGVHQGVKRDLAGPYDVALRPMAHGAELHPVAGEVKNLAITQLENEPISY